MKITEEMKAKYTDRLCFADSQLGMEAWVYYLDLLQPSPQPDTVSEMVCNGDCACGGICKKCKPDTVTKNHSDLGYIIPDQPPINNDHVAEGCEQFSQEIVDLNKDTVTISRESFERVKSALKQYADPTPYTLPHIAKEALSLLNAEGKV